MPKTKDLSRTVCVTMSPADHDKLTSLAQKMGVSRSSVVRTFLHQAIEATPATLVLQTPAPKE